MKKRMIQGSFVEINSFLLMFLFLLMLFSFYSCKKQAFFANEDALIRISANRTSIQLNENVRITIIGYDNEGSFLLDGTRVDLSIENGSLSQTWVDLESGSASITATADLTRGEMNITAQSGSVFAEPNPLVIQVGEIPDVNQIVANLTPSILPFSGGRIEIVVTVYDSYLQPAVGVSVILEADAGTLDSGGAALITNQNGQVIDYLETETECSVTIYAGDKTKTIEITMEEEPQANVMPVADFTYSPMDPISDETVYFNASASYDPDGNISRYTWDFGDGSSANGIKPSHKFDVGEFTSKTYTVNLTVYDNLGAHHTTFQQITVTYK